MSYATIVADPPWMLMSRPAVDVDRCPTCGETGPDTFDDVGDYGSGPYEARCGDEWHDDKLAFDEEQA